MENPDFEQLVSRIQAGEQAAMEELYKLFSRGIRYYLCRQLGPQDLEDKFHDTFVIVVEAIRRGDLREPGRLMGFVRTIVRRQVAAYVEEVVTARRDMPLNKDHLVEGAELQQERIGLFVDRKHNPEQALALKEKAALIKAVLDEMRPRDRQILTRFYLDEIPWQQICEEMNLSPQQFRLLKNRAKGKFGEIGRKKLTSHGIFSVLSRTNNQPNKLKLMQLGASITEKKAA